MHRPFESRKISQTQFPLLAVAQHKFDIASLKNIYMFEFLYIDIIITYSKGSKLIRQKYISHGNSEPR